MKKSILLAFVCAFNVLTLQVSAQVQVVESGAGQVQPRNSSANAPASNDLLVSLYNQLESLQEEVQSLRGLVEEQANRLRRLETESRDRYLDIDNRLSALTVTSAPVEGDPDATGASQVAAPGAAAEMPTGDVRTSVAFNPAVQGVAGRNGAAGQPSTSTIDPALSQLSEQDLYRTALNLLLEEGKSEESAAAFDAYLQRFPDGRLLPNALYWQGEALILLARYPDAMAAFQRVLSEFPGDAKAAGAMLKSGVVQNLQGNRSEAERIWQELPSRFPSSASEITLAREYLSRP